MWSIKKKVILCTTLPICQDLQQDDQYFWERHKMVLYGAAEYELFQHHL